MKFDVQLGVYDLKAIPEEAQRMERMGFDALWSFETLNDPFLALAFAATSTENLRVGTNIAVAFARTPMSLAMTSWDLQRASQGRFMLGLGTQVRAHIERRFGAQWGAPAARVGEAIRCIRAIWDCWQNGSKPDFKGEFYQFKLMTPFFNPGPLDHPEIPIYLAGVNPTILKVAGEVADGLHVHPLHSVRYLQEVIRPSLDEGARKNGRTVDDLELFAPVFVITGQTKAEEAEREAFVRSQIAFYASTPNYRAVMDLHGWSATSEKLGKMVRAGEWEKLGDEINDEMLDAFAVTGTPGQLPGMLRKRYQGLLQRVSLYFSIPQGDSEEFWTGFLRDFRASSP